jgi:hypothetical protein
MKPVPSTLIQEIVFPSLSRMSSIYFANADFINFSAFSLPVLFFLSFFNSPDNEAGLRLPPCFKLGKFLLYLYSFSGPIL